MRKRRLRLALLAIALLSVATSAWGSGPTRPDLRIVNDAAKIQWGWHAVAFKQRNGQIAPYRGERWNFHQGRFTLTTQTGRSRVEGTYKLDDKGHPPSVVIQIPGGRPELFA